MLLIPIAAKDSDFEAINVTSFSNCWLQIMLFFKRFADLMDMLILFRWYALFCKYSRSLQSFRRYGVARKWCPYSLIIMPDDWEYYHHIIQNYTLCYSLSRSFSWPLIYQEQGLGLIFFDCSFYQLYIWQSIWRKNSHYHINYPESLLMDYVNLL